MAKLYTTRGIYQRLRDFLVYHKSHDAIRACRTSDWFQLKNMSLYSQIAIFISKKKVRSI